MSDPVGKLKQVLNVDTDLDLARMLGLERSAIAQWRRRGNIPLRYRDLIDPAGQALTRERIKRADRRSIYGDGQGRYILSAALAFIPTHALEFDCVLSRANLGWEREARLINVVQVVLAACEAKFGKPRCESENEFLQLISALEEPEYHAQIALALVRGIIAEP